MNHCICQIILTLIALGNCDDNNDAQLTAGNNNFSAKIFTEIANNNVNKSFVLSSFSAITPLAQLSLASDGDTHDELLRAIGLPDDESIKSGFKNTLEKLKSINGIELKIVNKIYVANNYAVNDDYAAVSKEIFDSDVENVDFNQKEETSNKINAWVEDQTNHKVQNLLEPIFLSENTEALLVNTLHFKGMWKNGFDVALTTDLNFQTPDGGNHTVPMMLRDSKFNYGESAELDARILEIPYQGDEAAFYVLLPNEKDGIEMLEQNLREPSSLDNVLKNLTENNVEAHIPKFSIETTTNLKGILPKIGVEGIFKPDGTNLNKLLKDKENLSINYAFQKAFIEINEEGTEASAASGLVEDANPTESPQSTDFIADHPFVFVLKVGQEILFSGAYYS